MQPSDISALLEPNTLAVGFIFAFTVLGYMVFQDWRDGKFNKKNTMPDTGDPVLNRFLQGISESMKGLQAHYNDETTALLTGLQTDHKEQFGLLRELKDRGDRNGSKLDEILKYGVPSYQAKGER